MEQPDLTQFVSGGYFLIRASHPTKEGIFLKQVPETLLSLSTCISRNRLAVHWGWIPGDEEAALNFGIPSSQLEEFLHWCTSEYASDLSIWSMFHSVAAAQRFVQRFSLDKTGLYLIGVGLPKQLVAKWNEDEPNEEGVDSQIKQGVSLEEAGKSLGFEVASYGYRDFSHSWLCSGLDTDMYDKFGIKPGHLGLIQSETDAKRILDWMLDDVPDGETQRGEPEPYYYWLLMSYSLE